MGKRIAFASTRADKATANLYWQRADGTGEAQRLTESKNPQFPASWHPSGKFLAFHEIGPQTNLDIMEGDSFRAERPRQWSPGLVSARGINNRAFDLHPDGQRFAVLKATEQQAEDRRDKVVFIENFFIENFFEELRRVAPAARR